MFPASLPFDYLKHVDRYDRVGRMQARPTESRVRRPTLAEDLTT
jgi:hypothetical protein